MIKDKRLKLATHLDSLYEQQGKQGMYAVLHKTFSLNQLKYMIALEEEELNYYNNKVK